MAKNFNKLLYMSKKNSTFAAQKLKWLLFFGVYKKEHASSMMNIGILDMAGLVTFNQK